MVIEPANVGEADDLVFKIADDSGLLLLDLKDLRAMLKLMARSAASQLGCEVVRGVLGSLLGGRRRYQSPVVDVNDHV